MIAKDVIARRLPELASPRRNNFFYGKLLTEEHLHMEQAYFNEKRWLLNRLSLGMGVLCGLRVTSRDTDKRPMLYISPGVAIDALGREIIVPKAKRINPWKLTDAAGRSTEVVLDQDEDHIVSICLVYNQCLDDYERVWATDCQADDAMASTIVESFCVVVREERELTALPHRIPMVRESERVFRLDEPVASGEVGVVEADPDIGTLCEILTGDVEDRWTALAARLPTHCAPSGHNCVPLAIVELVADGEIGDITLTRTPVYSNGLLLEMIVCLSERLEECCQLEMPVIKALRVVAGNNQTAEPDTALPEPIAVQVFNAVDDAPLAGETVTFLPGSGTVDPESIDSDANGEAAATWTLGPSPGTQLLTVSIDSGAQVIFQATAAGEVGPPLIIKALRIIAGNNQTAEPDTALPEPIAVQVFNAVDDAPLAGETVTFLPGSGTVDPESIDSDANGEAAATWTLGPSPGSQLLSASIDSGAQVIFQATAAGDDGDVGSPPVINAIWPPNTTILSDNSEWLTSWRSQSRLEITFDRQMNEEDLQTPQNWLRVWQVLNYGDNEIVVKSVNLSYMGVTGTPLTGAEGVTTVYNMTTPPLEPTPNKSPRYLVQMRGDSVADTGAPPLSLDADFSGTELAATALDHIWNLPGEEWFGNEIWDGLVDTRAPLPSGDDSEGGRFHSWFEL